MRLVAAGAQDRAAVGQDPRQRGARSSCIVRSRTGRGSHRESRSPPCRTCLGPPSPHLGLRRSVLGCLRPKSRSRRAWPQQAPFRFQRPDVNAARFARAGRTHVPPRPSPPRSTAVRRRSKTAHLEFPGPAPGVLAARRGPGFRPKVSGPGSTVPPARHVRPRPRRARTPRDPSQRPGVPQEHRNAVPSGLLGTAAVGRRGPLAPAASSGPDPVAGGLDPTSKGGPPRRLPAYPSVGPRDERGSD